MRERPFLIGAVFTAFFVFQLVFLTSYALSATTAPSSIATSTTWTIENSPYIVNGTVVQTGATLTINPGVVVKFAPARPSVLTVNGSLNVNGTPGNKVYFTSLSDDSVGGDTNGDNVATLPWVGEWGNVLFTVGSTGSFNSTVVRYGGYWYNACPNCYVTNIANAGGTLSLNAVDISSSTRYGVWQSAGSTSITGAEIHNVAYGFYNTKGTVYISNTNFSNITTNGVYASVGEVTLIHNNFTNVALAGYISAGVTFIHASNTVTGGGNNGFAFDGVLANNQTLTADLPYLISGLVIPAGRTLTLGEGVIIKFYDGARTSMVINGTLRTQGVAENKVYFTSVHDDSVGGDSTNNGTSTVPSPGQWGAITFTPGSVGSFTFTVFRYGGYTYGGCPDCTRSNVYNNGGTLLFDNAVVVSSSMYGIYQNDGAVTILKSQFSNQPIGLYSRKGLVTVDATVFNNHASAGMRVEVGSVTTTNSTFTQNNISADISASTRFVHSKNTVAGNMVNGFSINGVMAGNQLWSADVPYVVGGLVIPIGITLSIDPGVVVKFSVAVINNVAVYGKLIVNGTVNNKVYFTSLYDDTVGGDTNGDGAGQVPGPGQWGAITFSSGSNSTINSAVIRYGGYTYSGCPSCYVASVRNNGGNLSLFDAHFASSSVYGLLQSAGTSTIVNSEFNNQQYGVYINRGTATVASSSFHHNTNAAISNSSASTVTAINNWWGDDSGPTVASNPSGKGQKIFGSVLYDPWIGKVTNVAPTLTYSSSTNGIVSSTIFLPEQPVLKVVYADANNDTSTQMNAVINGTAYPMSNTSTTWQTGVTYLFLSPTGTFVSGTFSYHFEASDGKLSTRLPANGELAFRIRNRPVIVVPGILGSEQKDGVWVMDPILHTYDNLLDTFRANGYADGVDLFTFPYQWRQSNVLTAFQLKDRINEVKAICGCDKVDVVAHSMGGLVARQYVESNYYQHDVDHLVFLGTPHLGSPEAYLTWEGGRIGRNAMDKLKELVFKWEAWENGYGTNIFNYVRNFPIVTVNELLPIFNYIYDTNDVVARSYPSNYPVNHFLENLNNSSSTLVNSGVKIINIIGDLGPSSTINKFRVTSSSQLPLWENGYPDGFDSSSGNGGVGYGNGDGTVPLESSKAVSGSYYLLNSEHSELATKGAGLVINKLISRNNPLTVSRSLISRLLLVKIFSPADIVVIAPDGKRIGKDFATNQEVNEIDGAFYSGFNTDDEYITIPNPIDGQYRVETQGTGNGGEYTVAAGYISDATSSSHDFVGHILPDQVTGVNITVDAMQNKEITIEPVDHTPPQITILSPTTTDYAHSARLGIIVNVTDTESGVFSQEIRLDDTMVNSGDSIDLFYKYLGTHTIFVTSSDFQGNISSTNTIFRIIATYSSTLSDIERAYSLGWIKNLHTKKELIEELKDMFPKDKHLEKDKEDKKGKHEKEEKTKKKELGREIIKELDKQLKKKNINQQAYDILKEDVLWLINN